MRITVSSVSVLLAALCTSLASQPQAYGLNLFADPGDGFIEFRTDPGTWPAVHPSYDGSGAEGWFMNTGEWYGNGVTSAVIPFQMPDFGAVVDPFLSANLGVHLFEIGTAQATNVDLYAIRTASTPDLLATDYYSSATPDPSATMIQAAFMDPSSTASTPSSPNIFTDAGGDAALLSYMNTNYAGGAGAGDYFFLRLSYASDTMPAGYDAYKITSRNTAAQGDWPVISFTIAQLPGDVDGDGDVDLYETDNDMISDFDIIKTNWLETNATFGQTLAISDGDLDLNGEVGVSDFREWKDAFNGPPELVAQAFASLGVVPEPSSIALALVTGFGLLAGFRRR